MGRGRNAAARFAERFDIPDDAFSGVSRLTLTGERRLHIERHRGILEYGRELISVNCGKKILSVYGAKLDLVSMSAEELLITGEIQRIEFS
ncbi:MAG: YabP/YqfC family sporulation protein [Oscillospiraceae bacterium]|jgi:sporulation protein YqfC|nr:YabP/YqfC family sporulation protein [Oscillospiraceae bacterium]